MKKIVAIGDSLTFGYLIPEKSKWVNIANESIKDINLVNKGINGDTTKGMYDRIKMDVLDLKPQHAIVWAGANDFYFCYYPFEDTVNYFDKIDQELEKNDIKAHYVLGPSVNLNQALTDMDKAVLKAMTVKFERLKNHFDEKNLDYLDLRFIFEKCKKDSYFNDSIHFNERGSKVIAQYMIDYLYKILKIC